MTNELENVRKVVMRRDGITNDEFDVMLEAFREELEEQGVEEAEELLEYWFGLEPDYLFDPELGIFG